MTPSHTSGKTHYRLHCALSPWIPRMGLSFVVWRVGDWGAWFQDCAKAIEAARISGTSGEK